MKIKIIKYIFSLLILFSSSQAISHNNLITKTITTEKNVKVKEGYSLDLFNSFGNIDIDYWDQNSIQFIVTVKAIGWDEEDTQEFAEKVGPIFEVSEDGESVLVKFDMNHVKSFCNPESGKKYRKWFNKIKVKHYSIDYVIKLPKTINQLGIFNNYGHVNLPDLKCNLLLRVKKGSLSAGELNLTKRSRLEFENSEVEINSLSWKVITQGQDEGGKRFYGPSFSLKACKNVTIDTIKSVNIKSSFSNIRVEYIDDFDWESNNDELQIQSINSFKGRLKFSKISIDTILQASSMKLASSNVSIQNISTGFNNLYLSGQYNTYEINLPENNYELSTDMNLTEITSTKKLFNTDEVNKAKYDKLVGKQVYGKNNNSTIFLKCMNCKVKLK